MFWGASLNIPQSRYEAASFTYQIALVSFSLSILQVPYNAAIVAHERMGVFAKISIVEVLLIIAGGHCGICFAWYRTCGD